VDRQIRVEIVRQLDAVGFRHQPQQRAVGVERPGRPLCSTSSRCSSSR
jgi:hypothetical protein